MNIPSIFKNRTFQVIAGLVALYFLVPSVIGFVFSKIFFIGLFLGVSGYLGYKHIYKPWKSQNSLPFKTNPHAYDSQAVQKQINKALKKFKN